MKEVRVIASNPSAIGGDEATTDLPAEFSGPCKLICDGQTLCAFPSLTEATSAAAYAIAPHGGFGSLAVASASTQEITHNTWQGWALD